MLSFLFLLTIAVAEGIIFFSLLKGPDQRDEATQSAQDDIGSFSHQEEKKTDLWPRWQQAKEVIKSSPQNLHPLSSSDGHADEGRGKKMPLTSSSSVHDLDGESPAQRSRGHLSPEVSLAEIADYDTLNHSYTLKKADLSSSENTSSSRLLAALKILNRQGMPTDYFRTPEYKAAYSEIDLFYPDSYIWPYFTNPEARANFFLFLFTKYADDNKNWRSYEKNKSDCSQFSQRIYLMLSPDEIKIQDEEYFRFLFSNPKAREERKKLCNKIPTVFYTTLTPYLLKKIRSTFFSSSPSGHAMISFAPQGHLSRGVILAEPQSGDWESLDEGNLGNILNNLDMTQYPLICQMGKILTIEENSSHEARTAVSGIYLIPRISPPADLKEENGEDPRWDYSRKPILISAQTYQLFQLISSYLRSKLNNQPSDRLGFLHSVEEMARGGKLYFSSLESDLDSSVNLIMHGLIDLEREDLRSIKDELEELDELATNQPSLSPQIIDFTSQLKHIFLLRLEPFLE